MKRRYYVASGPAMVGPYSKAEARIIKTVEPAVKVIPAPTESMAVVAGLWLAFSPRRGGHFVRHGSAGQGGRLVAGLRRPDAGGSGAAAVCGEIRL